MKLSQTNGRNGEILLSALFLGVVAAVSTCAVALWIHSSGILQPHENHIRKEKDEEHFKEIFMQPTWLRHSANYFTKKMHPLNTWIQQVKYWFQIIFFIPCIICQKILYKRINSDFEKILYHDGILQDKHSNIKTFHTICLTNDNEMCLLLKGLTPKKTHLQTRNSQFFNGTRWYNAKSSHV